MSPRRTLCHLRSKYAVVDIRNIHSTSSNNREMSLVGHAGFKRPVPGEQKLNDFADGSNCRIQTAFQVFSQGLFRETLAMLATSHLFALLTKKDVIPRSQHAKKIDPRKNTEC